MGVEYFGPHPEEFTVSIDGYKLPFIKMSKDDDGICLHLDNRFALPGLCQNEIDHWLPFLANAMAVAAGYSSHGERCKEKNPFNVKIGHL